MFKGNRRKGYGNPSYIVGKYGLVRLMWFMLRMFTGYYHLCRVNLTPNRQWVLSALQAVICGNSGVNPGISQGGAVVTCDELSK